MVQGEGRMTLSVGGSSTMSYSILQKSTFPSGSLPALLDDPPPWKATRRHSGNLLAK